MKVLFNGKVVVHCAASVPITSVGRKGHVVNNFIVTKKIANALPKKIIYISTSAIYGSPDGIITVNTKGVVNSCNPAFLRLTGYTKKEIIGLHVSELPTMRKREIPKYLKLFGSLLRGYKQKTFEFEYSSVTISIEEAPDDCYVLSGSTGEPFKGCMAVLIKIDSEGNVLLERQYGSRIRIFLDSFCYAISTDDGGIIGTGSRLGIGAFFNINLPWFPYWSKICVMKVDSGGNSEWGGSPPGNGQGRSIQKTSDGGYIVSGYTDNFPNFGDGVLFKIDSDGNIP